MSLSLEKELVMELIDRSDDFIFCPQSQSLQGSEYAVQMCLDSFGTPYKEVPCMYQLFDCPERLFNLPVLLFKLFEQRSISTAGRVLLIAIEGIVSLVVFCVHCPKHFDKIKSLQVGI